MQFINPYNFISLSDEPERSEENNWRNGETANKEELLTGVIEYTLTTRSRLHIPNTSTDKAFAYCPASKTDAEEGDENREHKRYDFYSYQALKDEEPDASGLKPGEVSAKNIELYEPVIPGSEVRGMVRTIYETLTNSCLPVIDGETRIGKRSVEQFKPGILIRDQNDRRKVSLHAAQDSIYRNSDDFSEKKYKSNKISNIRDGSLVYFKSKSRGKNIKSIVIEDTITEEMNDKYRKGYLLKGEKGPDLTAAWDRRLCAECIHHVQYSAGDKQYCPGNSESGENHCYLKEKHCAHIFEQQECVCKAIDEETLKDLELIITQYQNNTKTAPDDRKSEYEEYKRSYQEFMDGGHGLPVYYSKLYDGRYLLSPACITREVYRHTEKDIVKEYIKCGSKKGSDEKKDKNKVKMCAACSLFGIVSDEINQGSRIRFSDLQLDTSLCEDYKSVYDDKLLTLEELSTPKISATEFYLQRPVLLGKDEAEIWFWTYDYYIARLKNGNSKVRELNPMISGRKFYWHNRTAIMNAAQKTKRNRTVRTVKSGVSFKGKLYFDDITEKQLQQLIYIINFTDDTHGYKLGTGKPLGLGSVSLNLSSVQVRGFVDGCYQNQQYQHNVTKDSYEDMGFDNNVKEAFKLITGYMDPQDEKKIQYPKTTETAEGFEWFVNNRPAYKEQNGKLVKDKYPQKRTQVKIQSVLPSIKDGAALPIMSGVNKEYPETKNYRDNRNSQNSSRERNQTGGARKNPGVSMDSGHEKEVRQQNYVKSFISGKQYKAKVTNNTKDRKNYRVSISVKGEDGKASTSTVMSEKALPAGTEINVIADERNREFYFKLCKE